MDKITVFHPLALPHLDGGRTEQWCTYSLNDGIVYLLNGDRYEVASLSDIDIYTDIHFLTEEACHTAAAEYYHRQCVPYPYRVEWLACMKAPAYDNNVTAESKVMEFV